MKRYLLAATVSTLSAFAADPIQVERPIIIFHENCCDIVCTKTFKDTITTYFKDGTFVTSRQDGIDMTGEYDNFTLRVLAEYNRSSLPNTTPPSQ